MTKRALPHHLVAVRRVLREADKPMPVAFIARAARVNRTTTIRALKKLEEEGIVDYLGKMGVDYGNGILLSVPHWGLRGVLEEQ